VIDSGVDTTHPGLSGLAIDYDEGAAAKDDVIGHGTHVIGTIAAACDDATGVTGMTRPRLAVWKVLPDKPKQGSQFYIEGTPYVAALFAAAAKPGLAVVNMSLAGTQESDNFEPSAIKALLAAGVNVVAASGNGYLKGDPKMYPACYDGVFTVGSIAEDRSRSGFSSTAPYLDLVAPGSNVLSLVPVAKSDYRSKQRLDVQSGTSMAAAHVSAALALVAAQHPDWTAEERADRLRKTARKLPAMRGKDWTKEYGYGLLDLRAALSSKP
jgi:subtilisin family serine protease